MDDNNVQNSLCITSMKQELSGPTEAHGPFIVMFWSLETYKYSRQTLYTSPPPPLSRGPTLLSI